ncbi:MAG TPA: PilZ domain-containing protein [Pyrinomonadaceae bacterium]
MPDERRSEKRVTAYLPAKWEGMSGDHEARIEDISAKGCFVNTAGRVEINQVIGLEIELPSGKWLPLRGRVMSYQQGIGFGILFNDLSNDEELELRQLVAR